MSTAFEIPREMAEVLEHRGFRLVDGTSMKGHGPLKYENEQFTIQIFGERDGELYMKVSPLGQETESFYLSGVLAYLLNDDEWVRKAANGAQVLKDYYDDLVRIFGPQPSSEAARKSLQAWNNSFIQREMERMQLAAEKVRAERAARPWWKFW